MVPGGSSGSAVLVYVSDSPSIFFEGSPHSTGPPGWQDQDPNASSQSALPGTVRPGARLLPFGTLTHLKEAVLGLPSELPVSFLQEATFEWQCLDGSLKIYQYEC